MPLWLGMIMLTGIVVDNTIVLVGYLEIERERGRLLVDAIIEAGRLLLKPILMTTLAIGFGEGAELLRPLTITIVRGSSFSTLVLWRLPSASAGRPRHQGGSKQTG